MRITDGKYRALAARTGVVLAGTCHEGNIGAVARAMHNFGFADLRLAALRTEIGDEARRRAAHSTEILERAGIFPDVESATADSDIVIGTTRRRGKRRGRYFTPAEMSSAIGAVGPDKKICLLFGAEDFGLSNEQLACCDWLVTIEGGAEFDSFNLSHAVTIILYEIYRNFHSTRAAKGNESILLEGLFNHIEETLSCSGFLPEGPDEKRVMLAIRKMISRAGWSRKEINLFHAVLSSIDGKLRAQPGPNDADG